MSIKGRIRTFQLVVIFALIAMAITAYVGVRGTNNYLASVQLSRQQLDAAMQLAVYANRFSEQIAELLLVGEPERHEFESARSQTDAAVGLLRQLTLQEFGFLMDPPTAAEKPLELQRIDEMQRLFREIDLAVERVLLLDRQGQRAEAIALFRSEIENRLDAEFENLILAAVAGERAEVELADLQARELAQRLLVGTLALLSFLFVLTIGAGVIFARSIERPIGALAAGAQAIERGDFQYRIQYSNRDEFGFLAQRFNAMAEELERQRKALLAARNNLERQVEERTSEIADANRKLTQLDQQRARFLADVSHELRTPLTILRGEAEVTLRGTSKPESAYRAALSAIVSQASDMGRLIDDLLFVARSEADSIRLEFRRVPVVEVVSGAIQEAMMLGRDRDIDLAQSVSVPGPSVRADVQRLKQALLIVLDNASRYREAGTKVKVDVSVTDDGNAEIAVRNRGAIAPEEVPYVFDRFYRGASATQQNGTGLGLPIARWIVERHGGRIDLSTVDGQETEVRIEIPLG